jgi:glucose/arabinose dehydrogenase
MRAACVLIVSLAGGVLLQSGDGPFTDYRAQTPGTIHRITPPDLPRAFATASASNGAQLVQRPADAWPQAPSGFIVELFASGLRGPRQIRTAPNGDLFVAETGAGRVRVLRDAGAGAAPKTDVFTTGLTQPFGIAFYPPGPSPAFVYVANTNAVVRFPYESGDMRARGEPQVVVRALPTGGHSTRDLAFSLDGRSLFISVGSASNVDDPDTHPAEFNRANILETTPEGPGDEGLRVFASGIRNPVGLAVDPATGDVWTSVNERDDLGDNLPPDYITHVQRGGFYGWPWYYIGGNQDPRHAGRHPELRDRAIVPDVLVQPHNASLGLAIYGGLQFPAPYQGDIFAAEHGSWNRGTRTGYEVIRVRRAFGRATGEYEDFLTGFVTADGSVWGRPVGVAAGADGSLFVTDDGSNAIWRVRYDAARRPYR